MIDNKEWFSIANTRNDQKLKLVYFMAQSNPGTFIFLVYINDFTEGLTKSVKLFADDKSLFFSCPWL